VAFQSRHFLQIRICSSRSFKVNGITCDWGMTVTQP
jgi:hypothetical protein